MCTNCVLYCSYKNCPVLTEIDLAMCSLFCMQNCQLTETELKRFDKRADELNISVKISKINLKLAERLTPFSARMCSFTLSSLPGMEDGLDTRA